jgi:hypothetical protein
VIENSLGMKFVMVPVGEFMMGSDESPKSLACTYPQYAQEDVEALRDEAPRHAVRITRAFYLGRHEVTVDQFQRFIESSGYVPESIADGTGGYGYNPTMTRPAHRVAIASRDAILGTPGVTPASRSPGIIPWSTSPGMTLWPWPAGSASAKACATGLRPRPSGNMRVVPVPRPATAPGRAFEPAG